MNIIKQRKFKNNFRSITESSASFSQQNAQQKIKSLRENKIQLQEYRPLKSQIICLGPANEAAVQQGEAMKKKHYRYLRLDTAKETQNNKSLSKSISKSKTTSTESLRVHKIRSIAHQVEATRKIDNSHIKRDQSNISNQRQRHLEVVSNAYEQKNNDKEAKLVTQIKNSFQRLNHQMGEIHKKHKEESIDNKNNGFNRLVLKNKLIGIKIITKIVNKLYQSKKQNSFLLMISVKYEQ